MCLWVSVYFSDCRAHICVICLYCNYLRSLGMSVHLWEHKHVWVSLEGVWEHMCVCDSEGVSGLGCALWCVRVCPHKYISECVCVHLRVGVHSSGCEPVKI